MENVTQTPQNQTGQTVIIQQAEKQTNGIGVAGFILALIAVFIGWIPVFGWIIWLIGLILSFVGVFRMPKGLAIAGLVISLIGIFLLLSFSAMFAGAAFL